MASKGPSEACCTVPPAVVKEYKPKGKYIEVNGMQCYQTGPSTATSAIVVIYDIFGFSSQVLQGADILAHADDKNHQYQVYVPDYFHGKPLPLTVFPPDTDEKKKTLGDFFAGPAAPAKNKEVTEKVVAELKKIAPGVTKWGSLGMCWGGKIVSLTSQTGTPFTVAAEVHPAMVDPADAKEVTIPLCMLASGDEDKDAVKKFDGTLTVDKYTETFGDQIHGWMAARGNLEDPKVKAEYERGYKTLLEWYHKYL